MSQAIINISTSDANTGVTMRAALNAALQAIYSKMAGTAEMTTKYAYGDWVDSSNDIWYIRDAANSAWIMVGKPSMKYLGHMLRHALSSYALGVGTDTYTATLDPVPSYETGAHYFITCPNANTSTTPTLNLNSLGAKTIKRPGGVALVAGDIRANHPCVFKYDGTDMILLNPAYSQASVPASSITLATNAADGTDNNSPFYFRNGAAQNLAIIWHSSQSTPENTANSHGRMTTGKLYAAVYNDLADYTDVEKETPLKFGYVYVVDENFKHRLSKKYCEEGILGISTDTAGLHMGLKSDVKQVPISKAGYVLAYVDKIYRSGTPLTSTKGGRLTEMKREDVVKYPERMVATFYKPEKEKEWKEVKVNGRHWVKVRS